MLLLGSVWLLTPSSHETMPDFRQYEAGPERKQKFLEFLLPHIEDANAIILDARGRIRDLRDTWTKHGRISARNRQWLMAQAEKCDLPVPDNEQIIERFFADLLARVDIIPPSLALSQAALESGWGTSRFAREGNNLFGIWCYEPGCGLVPLRRSPGAEHEVKVYDTPRDSFLDYIWNLNSNGAYREMRRIRRNARVNDRPILGVELALGLARYSQEGQVYVSKVSSLIRRNDLIEYDQTPTG